jgi:protein TonB
VVRLAGPPAAFRIDVPQIIPTGIPPIDLGAVPTPIDYNELRATTPGCFHTCSTGTGADTSTSPLLTGAELAMRLRLPPVPPRYPEVLRSAGIEGTVLVKFAVDTSGRVDMQSVEVLSSSHDLFTAAVRESLTRLRFYPSEVNGRKVVALAQMPFQFTLKQ